MIEAEDGWSWRQRRDIEAMAMAIGCVLDASAAQALEHKFYLLDNENAKAEE